MNRYIRNIRLAIAVTLAVTLLVAPQLLLAGPRHSGHKSPMATQTNLGKSTSQTRCPVSRSKLVDRKTFVDCQGQRVYLCCPACKDVFLKNTETVFSKFERDGIVLDNVQKTCPVCDAPVDPKTSKSFTYKGRRIFYACPGCDKKFLEQAEKYLKKLDQESKASRKGGEETGSGHRHGDHGHHH
jgi:YHS domain-containing protein